MIEIYPSNNSSANSKSISESIRDQVFGLTYKEYANHTYRRQHKIIILTLKALITYVNNNNNGNNHDNNNNDRNDNIHRAFILSIPPSQQEQEILLEIQTRINSNNWIEFTTLCDHINSYGNSNNAINNTESNNSNINNIILLSSSSSLMILCQLLLDFLDTRSDYIWYL